MPPRERERERERETNLFCRLSDLHGEADVEALFVERLLAKLRYPDGRVQRKNSLDKIKIGRGSKKESYRPDFVLQNRKGHPVVIVDAKSPDEQPSNFLYQVSGYALALNQRFEDSNPVLYTVLTNGLELLVYPWDSEKAILKLKFEDFQEDDSKFVELRSLLSYGALEVVQATEDVFEFKRPELNRLIKTFTDCHNLIWKKEKIPPTDAFYEFAKLLFIKLREDNRIAKMIADGKKPTPSDFNFSVAWIEQQVEKGVDENPMANILFRKIRDELEEKIRLGQKKRIFLKDDILNLRLTTVIEVGRMLEHFDLHGIDEDLNGRMFETFLNATVRGKSLGQFFTPRSIVKYMTRTVQLTATRNVIPNILDGCCGSGGFLIEAMAELVHCIDRMTSLSSRERVELKKRLYEDHLFGVDANEKIARIARLNMYLHGDGGSKIFTTDMLDKELNPDKGLTEERRSEAEELQGLIIRDETRFDAILTNPPFSMKYKTSDPHEARILNQYQIAVGKGGARVASLKSNVLFLERYLDLLKDDGQLTTIIDNTVLNGDDSQQYRDFILENFIIRQVVSLPFNAFFRAQANVQTSILHLKKKRPGEKQGPVFMAILNNIGHDDHQRYTPDRDNTPELEKLFLKWLETGQPTKSSKPNSVQTENLGCPFQTFVVPAAKLVKSRLDAFYYSPELCQLRKNLKKLEKDGQVKLLRGRELSMIPAMRRGEEEAATGKVFKYFEIGYVTSGGAITKYDEAPFDDLPTRARLQVRTNDVIFAKNNSSRGTAVIIPKEFDGQLVTTGFIGIRPKNYDEALLLWSIFQSEAFRNQIYYLAITAVQPEVREDIFQNEFLLPIPTQERDRTKLIEQARRVHELHVESQHALEEARRLTNWVSTDKP